MRSRSVPEVIDYTLSSFVALRNANRAKSITYGALRDCCRRRQAVRVILPLLYIQIDGFVGGSGAFALAIASVLRHRQ
jgi:hypothetical protein